MTTTAPDFKHKNHTAEDFSYVGARLREIREELIEIDVRQKSIHPNESFFARKSMAEYFGLNYQTYTNIEGGVFSHNTLKIILFFHQYGYNPNWMLVKDNDFINKKNLDENFTTKVNVKDEFKEMKDAIDQAMNDFKKKL